MSKICKKPPHCKGIDDHQKYFSRITKTLYYGKLPKTDMLSLPLTEFAVEIFSEAQKGKSLERLHINTAAQISRKACVSPCSLVLAILYFERLKKYNADYLERTVPSDLFLVSLMVSSKFLFDDGEIDEVFMDEWAASSGMTSKQLVQLERDFLKAIDWKIYANDMTFWNKLSEIEIQLATKEGCTRGFFTYTELLTLRDTIDLYNIVHCLAAISILLAATYTAAFLTVVGSVALASTIPGTSLYQSRVAISNTVPLTTTLTIEENTESIQPVLNQTKTSTFTKCYNVLNLNVVKVFKASILLASIKTNSSKISPEITDTKAISESNCKHCQYISWDWWNIPVMNWLSKTADYVKTMEMPVIKNYIYFLENTVTNEKFSYLKDHIHKATKTRIQDQLERSWHVEWTDTIKNHLYYNIWLYLQSVKS